MPRIAVTEMETAAIVVMSRSMGAPDPVSADGHSVSYPAFRGGGFTGSVEIQWN
jgi:hypothetical protein